MGTVAEYLIVQHLSDPFRRESQNVGVFVRIRDEIKAKFFGEISPGDVDRRKIRTLPFPGPYAQWVLYWRRIMQQRPEKVWDEVKRTARENYQIIDGGVVDGIGHDSIDDVVTYLYSVLVSEGGIAAALGAPDEAIASIRLADAIEDELKRQNLFDHVGPLFKDAIKHPVRRDVPVQGKTATHLLSFVQRNGHPIVMEPIDLGVKRDKSRIKDRAGWASLIFKDIQDKEPDAEAIALISATPEEEKQDIAKYAKSLLQPHVTAFVNWQSAQDRNAFINARAATARST